MKKLFLILIITCIASLGAWAQTSSVSATITDSTSQAYANGTYDILFRPAPGVPGNSTRSGSAFTQHFSGVLDASGAFAVTLTRNDFIQPGGSQWTFTICPLAASACFTSNQTIAAASVNLTSALHTVTPLISVFSLGNIPAAYSSSEIVVTPNPGSFFWNLTTGTFNFWNGASWTAMIVPTSNITFTGTNSFTGSNTGSGAWTFTGPFTLNASSNSANGFTLTNPGVFTNTQYNAYVQGVINGCNPSTEFVASQGANFSTDGLTGCVLIPVSATVHQVNGVAGYAQTSSSSVNAVGVYGQARALTSAGNVWGGNFLAQDSASTTTTRMEGLEVDINVNGPPSLVYGIQIAGQSAVSLPANSAAFTFGPLTIGRPWPIGVNIGNQAATVGIAIGTLTGAAFTGSMPLNFGALDGASASIVTGLTADFLGDVSVASNGTSGGAFLATHFRSNTGNIAGTGLVELAKTDKVSWRNNANGADLPLGINGSDALQFNSINVTQTIGTGNVTTAGTAVTNGTCQAQTGITVSGTLTTDSVTANIGAAPPATWQTGIVLSAHPTGSNTVTVYLCNPTAGSITPAATQVNVRVTR